MEQVRILGSSHAMVSMLMETLGRIHGDDVQVVIVENVPIEEQLAFAVEGVPSASIAEKDWDHQEDLARSPSLLCGVYRPGVKRKVFGHFCERYGIGSERYSKLIHPGAEVASTAKLGNGVTVGPLSAIAPYAVLGNLVSVNRSVSIGHHTVIGGYATLNPGAHVAGRCRIGAGVTLGMGAIVVDGVSIGENSAVGAGALVTRDVPANVLVYGTPAKVVRSLT
jgi:sugar O-acyltransferase (sialic acid O-acetyltransferase NeuD family)